MDQATMKLLRLRMKFSKSIYRLILPSVLGCWILGCGTAPIENKNTLVNTSTPGPPPGEKIEKATNVVFSTYSKEWPVNWQWIDPDVKNDPTPHDVKTGVLRIRLSSKRNLNGMIHNAPRYLKPIAGDFQIETRVKFLPTENFQGAGLLIWVDDNNFLSLQRAYGGVGGGPSGIRLDANTGGDFQPIFAPGTIQTDVDKVELKLVRNSKVFTAYWRESENVGWRLAGEYTSDYADTIMAGIVACNTAREVTVEFPYIRLLPPTKK